MDHKGNKDLIGLFFRKNKRYEKVLKAANFLFGKEPSLSAIKQALWACDENVVDAAIKAHLVEPTEEIRKMLKNIMDLQKCE